MKERIFKKKIKKRVFSVALALALVITLMPMNSITVYAADFTKLQCSAHPGTIHAKFTSEENSWWNAEQYYATGSFEKNVRLSKVGLDQMTTISVGTWAYRDGGSYKNCTGIHSEKCTVSRKTGQSATCTEDGWNNYYQCTQSTCGKIFASTDITGTSYATLDDWKVSEAGKIAKGHTWSYNASGATLTATCGRGSHTATLTLTAAGPYNDGIEGLDDFNKATGRTDDNEIKETNVKFYKVDQEGATTGGDLVQGTPSEEGYYYASLNVDNATAVKAFTIGRPSWPQTVHPISECAYPNGSHFWYSGTTFQEDDQIWLQGIMFIEDERIIYDKEHYSYYYDDDIAAGGAGWYEGTKKCELKHVSEVTVNKTSLSLQVGDTETLVATVLPEDATEKGLYWTSSDSKIATVDQTGKVTAVSEGKVSITVVTNDLSNKFAKIDVNVEAPKSVESGNGSVDESSIQPGMPATAIAKIDLDKDINLDDNEKAAVEAGTDYVVGLMVTEPETNDKNAEFEAIASENGLTVGKYIDISMVLVVPQVSMRPITTTNNEVMISIKLPAELIDANVDRRYYVIRDHEGEKTILPASYDEETGNIYFASNKFSTYAIAYVDKEIDKEKPEDEKTPGETPTPDEAPVPEEEPVKEIVTIPVYRVYNPNSGLHFYTVSEFEKDYLVSLGWNEEGIDFYAPEYGAAVYRAYNPANGDHYFTTSKAEIDALVANGWNDEGLAWYSDGELSVYKVKNPNAKKGQYFYTSNKKEYEYLVSLGWEDLGVAWKSMLTW